MIINYFHKVVLSSLHALYHRLFFCSNTITSVIHNFHCAYNLIFHCSRLHNIAVSRKYSERRLLWFSFLKCLHNLLHCSFQILVSTHFCRQLTGAKTSAVCSGYSFHLNTCQSSTVFGLFKSK